VQLLEFSNTDTKIDGHYINGFLIGTKQTQEQPIPWRISKTTATLELMKKRFIGKPFMIMPDLIENAQNPGFNGHFEGKNKDETLQGYIDNAHGFIEDVTGPFPYNDGTNDFYFKHITQLNGSRSASILQQYGQNTILPFATSPHIWIDDSESPNNSEAVNYDGIGIALVVKGAFGNISVINKMCSGSGQTCKKSLSASTAQTYAENDAQTSKIIFSSLHSKNATSQAYMSLNTQSNPASSGLQPSADNSNNNANTTINPQQTLTQSPPTQTQNNNQIVLTKEEYDRLLKSNEDIEATKKTLAELQNEYKTNVLNGLFTSEHIADETTRTNLIEKWKGHDVKLLKDFYNDVYTSIFASILEKTKAQAEQQQTPVVKEEDKKSKSASILKPEPKIADASNSKSASVEDTKINEVLLLRKYLNGGI